MHNSLKTHNKSLSSVDAKSYAFSRQLAMRYI